MQYTNKIFQLRNIINEKLLPLIDNDYIYLDLPYYTNIGDLLIWEGTLEFLSQTKHKCLYSTDADNFRERKINENTIVILQGGGNWGDLWEKHHIFRKKIVQMYPKNKIIVFPQTVYYQDKQKLFEDIEFYNNYPNVIICVRDNVSYNILELNLKNNKILLVPDMAFFVNIKKCNNSTGKILFAKRTDKELSSNNEAYNNIPQSADIYDWPTYETDTNQFIINRIFRKLIAFCNALDNCFHSNLKNRITDLYWKIILKKYYINMGIKFLSNYSEIYSTRLHISILSILMNKKIHIIDNSYGKTSNYIKTWFTSEERKYFLDEKF